MLYICALLIYYCLIYTQKLEHGKFDDEFEFDQQKEIASYTISQIDIEKWQFVKKLILP